MCMMRLQTHSSDSQKDSSIGLPMSITCLQSAFIAATRKLVCSARGYTFGQVILNWNSLQQNSRDNGCGVVSSRRSEVWGKEPLYAKREAR